MTKDEAIAKVLETALNGLQKTGEFVVEQAPDVVRQLIAFHTAYYVLFVALAVVWYVVGYTVTYQIVKRRKAYIAKREYHYSDTVGYEISGAFCAVGTTLGATAMLCTNVINLLKITLAPKVWLLEYAASLVLGAT